MSVVGRNVATTTIAFPSDTTNWFQSSSTEAQVIYLMTREVDAHILVAMVSSINNKGTFVNLLFLKVICFLVYVGFSMWIFVVLANSLR
jgi:hypothetical protein